jgi:hypothetical protein
MNRRPKQLQKDIREIVDFYMLSVTDYHSEIRESLEYSWSCMSAGTIEDYLDLVRSRVNLDLNDQQIKAIFVRFYGEDAVFDDYKLDFLKEILRVAKQQRPPNEMQDDIPKRSRKRD